MMEPFTRRLLKPAIDSAAVPVALFRDFLRYEAAGGLVLMASAALAIVLASTPLEPFYEELKALPIVVTVGNFGVAKPFLHWVNDGLMALFFFMVGLEIKREVLRGRAFQPAQGAAARSGCAGRNGGAGADLFRPRQRACRGRSRLGHSGGDRYRLCAGRDVASGPARAAIAEGS